MGSVTQQYTDARRIEALAALEANGGRLRAAARETGVPVGTLSMWRNAALIATQEGRAFSVPERVKTDWVELWGEAVALGASIIAENLRRYAGQPLKPSELRDVAIVSGIAADKHLDYRDGRKAGVVVDNRQQSVTLPEGTSLEDIRALRDALKDGG